jgi:hypothetical protein
MSFFVTSVRAAVLIGLLCWAGPVVAFPDSTITAIRVDRAPRLDGNMSDPQWQLAEPVSHFVQREPEDNAPATEQTEVRLVYTDRALYVGAWCYDREADKISSYSLARDFNAGPEDVFLICLDTYHDHRNSYYIATNANGARFDALAFNDGASYDMHWNGVWDVRTTRDDRGFYVEMEIPFSTLRFTEDSVQVWGVNFERDVQRRREYDFWQPLPRGIEAFTVSRAGTLLGLKNIRRGNDIEFKPYGVAGWEGKKPVGRDKLSSSTLTKLGLDVKMPLTSTLTLDLTANPDFTQVEDDRAVINLTRFPYFQSENREFFLESSGTFGFNYSPGTVALFYSRNIGLRDVGYGQFKSVPILGGARVVGKAGKFDVGALVMQTASQDSLPTINYSVARLKRNIFQTSYIGILATNKELTNRYNRTFGTDALFRFPNVYKTDLFEMGGAAAKSFTPELEDRQNGAYRFYAAYPNRWLEASASVRRIEKNFNPEVGYVQRYGSVFNVYSVYRFVSLGHGINSIGIKPLDITYFYDLDGRVESIRYGFQPFSITSRSGEYAQLSMNRNYDRLQWDYPVIGQVVVPAGEYWYNDYSFNLGTSASRDMYVTSTLAYSEFYYGESSEIYVEGALRPNCHLNLAMDYDWNKIRKGLDHAITNNVGCHVDYAFSTQWLTSAFFQWNDVSNRLGMNLRLHWIPSIGSDVYLAYNHRFSTTQNRMVDGMLSRTHDFRFEDATILCKMTYRIVV